MCHIVSVLKQPLSIHLRFNDGRPGFLVYPSILLQKKIFLDCVLYSNYIVSLTTASGLLALLSTGTK